MTAQEFTIWLDGYLTNKYSLTEDQIECIMDRLYSVEKDRVYMITEKTLSQKEKEELKKEWYNMHII